MEETDSLVLDPELNGSSFKIQIFADTTWIIHRLVGPLVV